MFWPVSYPSPILKPSTKVSSGKFDSFVQRRCEVDRLFSMAHHEPFKIFLCREGTRRHGLLAQKDGKWMGAIVWEVDLELLRFLFPKEFSFPRWS